MYIKSIHFSSPFEEDVMPKARRPCHTKSVPSLRVQVALRLSYLLVDLLQFYLCVCLPESDLVIKSLL